jgi:hypothetical protein
MLTEQPNLAEAKGKTYHTPTLSDYGCVRDLTLGGSPGSTDSGDPFNEDQPVEP